MVLIAVSLTVASIVHLVGHVQGRSDLYDARDAGIAEAVIATVLTAGAVAMVRLPDSGRAVGLGATGFAIVGFLIGLSITARAGHLPDIAYHAAILPLLIAIFTALVRMRPSSGPDPSLPRRLARSREGGPCPVVRARGSSRSSPGRRPASRKARLLAPPFSIRRDAAGDAGDGAEGRPMSRRRSAGAGSVRGHDGAPAPRPRAVRGRAFRSTFD